MRRLSIRRVSALVLGIWLASAAATTYLEMTLDEMVAAADIAVYGEVESTSVEERDDLPWTRVLIAVERDLAPADEPSTEVELWFLGGALPGGRTLVVAGMPSFEAGERILVLAYDERYASPVVGFEQGLWRLVGDRLVGADGRRLGFDGDAVALALDAQPAPVGDLLDALQERLEARP